MEISVSGDFAKVDEERRRAFGWAYVTDDGGDIVLDHSGDFVDAITLPDFEEAVYGYMLKSREADEMHERFDNIAKVVESVMVTPEKLKAMGLEGTRTGWWVGFKVEDDDVWEKVKTGKLAAFSIRGRGERQKVDG